MNIICKTFEQLSTNELYQILALRSEIFVVEQNCAYQDLDFKDQHAIHCLGRENDRLAAYTRIFDQNVYFADHTAIGRVVVASQFRRQNLGKEIMLYSIKKCTELFGEVPIKIGAQVYLENFYKSLGFETTGNHYLEDGIPHQIMIKIVS